MEEKRNDTTISRLEKARQFWKNQLAEAHVNTRLFAERNAKESGHGILEFSLSELSETKLNELTNGSRLAQFAFSALIFQELIVNLSMNDKASLAYPQMKKGTDLLFLNYAESASVKEGLIAVSQQIKETVAHQLYPYTDLLNGADKENFKEQLGWFCITDNELIDSAFDLSRFSNSKLTLICDGGQFKWQYCKRTYSAELISYVSNVFVELTCLALENIDTSFREILTKIANKSEFKAFCEGAQVENKFATLQNHLSHSLQENGERVALKLGATELTYQEIETRIKAISSSIRQDKDYQTNAVIAVKNTNPIHVILGVLASVKCGNPFTVISTEEPQERVEKIMSLAGAKQLISGEEIPTGANEMDAHRIAEASDCAYIVFTSGTSGNPKGIKISHKNVVNTLEWHISHYNYGTQTIALNTLAFQFDAAIEAVFSVLLSGGKLVLFNAEEKKDLQRVSQVLVQEQVNTWVVNTSYFSALLKHLNADNYLEKVILGGEYVFENLRKQLESKLPNVALHIEYGLTETTITSHAGEYTAHDNLNVVGKPIRNTKVFVVNEDLKPVMYGQKGQIVIGGEGVAIAYIGTDSTLRQTPFDTEEAFVVTGDTGIMHPDGSLEFFGRKDDQVKIRGHRVELLEIEQVIEQFESVDKALVLLSDSHEKHSELVCFFQAKTNLNSSDLDEFLAKKLPQYMLPNACFQVDEYPLTANGKIDKKQLLHNAQSQKNEIVKPETDTEKELAQLWSKLLSIPDTKIGAETDFFKAGGHSLLATELILAVQSTFGSKLAIDKVFRYPTLRKMAGVIDACVHEELDTIEKADSKELYVASSSQKRLYFLNKMDETSTSYNMPMYFPLGKKVDQSLVEKTLNLLVDRHPSLRTNFVEKDNTIYQKISEDSNLEITYLKADSSSLASIKDELIRPFNLNDDLLIRSAMIELADNEKVLFIDLHHVIADGRSCSILMEDFWGLYGGTGELPEKVIDYVDYAEWQHQLSSKESYQKQERYWLERLDAVPKSIDLPSDQSRPEVFHFEGSEIYEVISGEMMETMKGIAHETGATLHMVFIALMKVLLYKYSGQTNLVLGTTIEGRNHAGLDRIVGMFVNSLVITSAIDENASFLSFVETVKTSCIEAYENQDVQFESLIEELNVERDPSRNPLFDVCVVSQNFRKPSELISEELGAEFEANELDHSELVNENTTAKFDLTLFLEEIPNGVFLKLEYYTGILDETGARRIMSHLRSIVESLHKNSKQSIAEIHILDAAEQATIRKTQLGAVKEYKLDSVVSLIEKNVQENPDKTALEFGDNETLSYAELDERSNKIGNYLKTVSKLESQSTVGILVSKNDLSIPVMLGALKTGMIYLPLDPKMPIARLKTIVQNANCKLLFTDKKSIGIANTLQWQCTGIQRIMALDSLEYQSEIENLESEKLLKELWNHVAANAKDEIDLGGWTSSFTGLNFSKEEMDEYASNAVTKIQNILPENARVLEIGCASGLTMYPLLDSVAYYHGTDISEKTIEWNANKAKNAGYNNVGFQCLSAWEIDQVLEKDFDVIVINSVVQSFSGYNYFQGVMQKCFELLKPEGKIFLGDLMDLDRKDALVNDLKKFRLKNHDKGFDTRIDYTNELFLNRRFFNNFQAANKEVNQVTCSEKEFTIHNELTDYRFDAVLSIDKSRKEPTGKREVFQDDIRTLNDAASQLDSTDLNPDNVAYMIYTSGTTGVPKGVKIQNKALVNYCMWAKEKYVDDLDRGNFPLYSSITFDLTVTSIYLPLISGNTIVCYDGNYKELLIKDIFEENKVDVVKLTPSHLRLLNTFELQGNTAIKRLILGGEQLTEDVVKETWKTFGRKVIIENEYGPTEATVGCMIYTCDALIGEQNIPIGAPIANTEIFILDTNGKEVPVGVKGELFIGGDSLAAGYHALESLNAKSFVPSPLSAKNRIYKTGDEAKIHANGVIEYIGRVDNQVKIRGFRVEKDEIKTRLEEQSEIDEAVILHNTDAQGQLFLSAYLKVSKEQDPIIIRERLKEHFPEYMIPDYIIQLEQFPLTSHGKIDEKSLPDPRKAVEGDYEVASTNTEIIISGVWREVLGLNVININESFFKLGGNSLKLVMVFNQLQEKLNAQLAIANLFEYPTIKNLAQFIDSENDEHESRLSDEELEESTDQLSEVTNLFGV